MSAVSCWTPKRSVWSRAVALLTAGVAQLGCGPSVLATTDCEGSDPVRLLPLDRGDAKSSSALRDARGWVITGSDGYVWAVECGVQPRRIFEGWFSEPARPDLPWFGFRTDVLTVAGGTLYYPLRPWGESEPEPIPGTPLGLMGDAIVFGDPPDPHHDPEPRLVRVTAEGARARMEFTPLQLLQDPVDVSPAPHIPIAWGTMLSWRRPIGIPNASSALANVWMPDDPTGTGVVEIDLLSGESRLLRAGVEVENLGRGDERFVLLELQDPGTGIMQDILLDRLTGRETPVGMPGWMTVQQDASAVRSHGADQTHLHLLPEQRDLWLAGTWVPAAGVAPDGRRVLVGPDGTYVLAPDEDVPVFLDPTRGVACVAGDAVYVADYGPGFDFLDPGDISSYRVIRVGLDGYGATDLFGAPVDAALPLEGGRWAVIRDAIGDAWEDRSGDLVVVDPGTGTEAWIAGDVAIHFPKLNGRVGATSPCRQPWLAVDRPSDGVVFARWDAEDDEDNGVWWLPP